MKKKPDESDLGNGKESSPIQKIIGKYFLQCRFILRNFEDDRILISNVPNQRLAFDSQLVFLY